MIVVDTNIIAYLYLPGEKTELVEKLLLKDSEWVAPYLWRSGFRNVLANYLRNKLIGETKVFEILDQAETQMEDNEYLVKSWHVMKLVSETLCSAYDCEFAALAEDLQVPLITTDKKLAHNFPKIAKALKDYIQ